MKRNKNKNELFGVIGLGRFGMALTQKLVEKGKDVIAVDKHQDKVNQASLITENAFAVNVLDKTAMEKIGIQDCDTVIICIGEDLAASVMTTLTAIKLGVKRVIAKAKNEDHGSVLEMLGAEVIYPEHDMGERLAKRLTSPRLFEYLSISDKIDISEIVLTEKINDVTVADISIRRRFGLNIIALRHNDEVITDIGPQTRLFSGDSITVIGKSENVVSFEESLE